MVECLTTLVLSIVFVFIQAPFQVTLAENLLKRVEIPSSPNPVGSGARALGMGGAFIAIADDATAASWNPGGLTQLETPEISAVGAYFHRTDDNTFGTNPEASGDQSVSNAQLNYLSATYPFSAFDFNMVVSVNFQNLYDFDMSWQLPLNQTLETYSLDQNLDIQQDGSLSAYGLAYSIQVHPSLSFGFTLNLWQNGIYDNKWKRTETSHGTGFDFGDPFVYESNTTDQYTFTGYNANIGILWNITSNFTFGAVFKTPFTADVKREFATRTTQRFSEPAFDSEQAESFTDYGEMDMPMSYGIGLAYRFSDQFTMAADVYRTEWGDYIYRDSKGNKTCPITGLPQGQSDVDATNQVRLGAEYLFISEDFAIPLRAGLFYDPAPAQGSPDTYYGASIGSGIAYKWFVFDVAYQYRFGKNVGQYMLQDFNYAKDVYEHTVYSSIIIHF